MGHTSLDDNYLQEWIGLAWIGELDWMGLDGIGLDYGLRPQPLLLINTWWSFSIPTTHQGRHPVRGGQVNLTTPNSKQLGLLKSDEM